MIDSDVTSPRWMIIACIVARLFSSRLEDITKYLRVGLGRRAIDEDAIESVTYLNEPEVVPSANPMRNAHQR